MAKERLFGKSITELKNIVSRHSLPSFAAMQIAEWMYKKHVLSIEEMTNLSKANRQLLTDNYDLGLKPPVNVQESKDGTKKYLFPAANGKFIESAFIPERNRNTLCLSTQVGCKMGCLFCMTGKQGFQGNLTAGEILNQLVSLPERNLISNIVYMGMGEPLDNLDEVLKSLEILTSEQGFGLGHKRITVSTVGIIPAMKTFLKKSNVHLAVSLHSPFNEERKRLMPVEAVYPISEVVNVIRQADIAGQRRISFEYILFKGVNDTQNHVKEIARLLNGLSCRINLIRFHPVPGIPLKSSDDNTLEQFLVWLNAKGIRTTVRASRGLDIAAACGLLSTKGK